MRKILKIEFLALAESEDSTRSSNDDMRGSFFIFENLLVFLDWHATKENFFSQLGEEL